MIAKKKIRSAARRSAAFRARTEQLGFAYVGLVIGNVTFDGCPMWSATAEAVLYAAGHPAGISNLGCKDSGRRDGADQ